MKNGNGVSWGAVVACTFRLRPEEINLKENMKRDPEKIKKFQKALIKLKKKNDVRTEELAVKLKISNATILSWMSGIRCPNFATVKFLEKEYGMKML